MKQSIRVVALLFGVLLSALAGAQQTKPIKPAKPSTPWPQGLPTSTLPATCNEKAKPDYWGPGSAGYCNQWTGNANCCGDGGKRCKPNGNMPTLRITPDPATARINVPIELNIDPNIGIGGDHVNFAWGTINWDDGPSESYNMHNGLVRLKHTYRTGGKYVVRVEAGGNFKYNLGATEESCSFECCIARQSSVTILVK